MYTGRGGLGELFSESPCPSCSAGHSWTLSYMQVLAIHVHLMDAPTGCEMVCVLQGKQRDWTGTTPHVVTMCPLPLFLPSFSHRKVAFSKIQWKFLWGNVLFLAGLSPPLLNH